MHGFWHVIRSASRSLKGHVVFFQVAAALPLFVALTASNYSEGTLTLGWTVRIALVSSAAALFVAVVGWYAITRPFVNQTTRKP